MPKESARSPLFSVVDDFLDEQAWTELWTHLQFAPLAPVSRTEGAWKLSDGTPLGGDLVVTPARDAELVQDAERPELFPSGTPIDHVLQALLEEPEVYERVVGDEWKHICARAYVYPQGTSLSWHSDDQELYCGAFVYYAHPHWNAHWGGELLIAEEAEASGRTSAGEPGGAPLADEPRAIMGHRFANDSYSERLMQRGQGSFVAPKPNRLVVLSGAAHSIARVSVAAGEQVRASVSGFFLRKAQP